MKSIDLKALITLLVISMSLCATLNRETKSTSKTDTKTKTKTSTKTGNDGSGSWNAGFVCPKMTITKVGGSEVSTGNWGFKPANMGSWTDGFEIESLTPTSADEKDIMLTSGGKVYIPWRFIDGGDVTSGKFTLSYKFITFKVVTDTQTTYKIVLYMPYADVGNYISGQEVTSIANSIVNKVSSTKNLIKTTKTTLREDVKELTIAMLNKQTALGNAQAIKDKAVSDNLEIKAKQAILVAKLNSVKIQIATKVSELGQIINNRDSLNTETSSLGNEIDGDTLLLDSEARNKAIAGAATKITQLKKDVTHEINSIKGLAADAYCVAAANEAQAAVFALDAAKSIASSKKIYSWNESKP